MLDFDEHEEYQYLQLVRSILRNKTVETGRNGDTFVRFGHTMRFSLRDGQLPLLTTKRVAWKTCAEELFWFIRGSTNVAELKERNVHIWDDNATREFLDSRGLHHLDEDDLGPVYGHQWRHYNAPYHNNKTDYSNAGNAGVDQLANVIELLKNPETRGSRRIVMTAWNPCQLDEMALPPCHLLCQFHVRENRYLSCALYQRSADVGLGVPFNIASYALLTHILAKHCGLEAEEFIHFLGNCHIYAEHADALLEQTGRTPTAFPKIDIVAETEIENYNVDSIVWKTAYICQPAIKMRMMA